MLKVKVKEPYTAYIGSGKIIELNNLLKEYNRALIVFDSDVYKLYKDKVSSAISKIAVDTFILKKGEDNKDVKILSSLLEKFNELNLNKSDAVISTGGGAVTDEENILNLKQNGVLVFIKRRLDEKEIKKRILFSKKQVKAVYKERFSLYNNCCDIKVKNDKTVNVTARRIIDKLK